MHRSVLRQADSNLIPDLINAFYGSATICAASELGIFGGLAHLGECGAEGVAQALKLEQNSTTLLLNACVALGLLEKHGELYRNSHDAEVYLVPGARFDLSMCIRERRDAFRAWASLAEFARTGQADGNGTNGRETDTARLAASLLSLQTRILSTGRPVIRRLDLHGRRQLLDVGGGPGTYSVLISLEFPQLHCTVLERPEAVQIASALIEQQGVSSHVSMLGGDHRSGPLPEGNDVVLLFDILHRETAAQIPELLRRAADSLRPGGVVYVMDVMTDESRTIPPSSALFALNLALTHRDGCVFSHVELQGWMEQAGLRDFAVEALPAPMTQWLARAVKPA